jgi:hypothetical protein
MTVMRALFALALLAAAAGCSGQPSAPSATPTPSTTAPASTSVASPSSTGNVDGFLAALRTGGVPVSESGEPERLISRGICQQIHAGASPDKLAHDLTASGYTLAQASTLVAAAQENFCG